MSLRSTVRSLLPSRVLHAYRVLKHTVLQPSEPELVACRRYLLPNEVAVDIGADVGLYASVLSKRAKRVICFEPNPNSARHLRSLGIARTEVVEAALSDRLGTATLHVPEVDGSEAGALGTISADNPVGKATGGYKVRTARLDDELLTLLRQGERVGFVKIDVEGHELAVLRGAEGVIAKHRPVLLVELEARHGGDIPATLGFMAERGYEARAILSGNDPEPVDAAVIAAHQTPEHLQRRLADSRYRGYLNNIFFLPHR